MRFILVAPLGFEDETESTVDFALTQEVNYVKQIYFAEGGYAKGEERQTGAKIEFFSCSGSNLSTKQLKESV